MNVKINYSYIYIVLSIFFVYVLYNFSSQLSIVYSENIVPRGDPFSYELNLIRLNNESSSSIYLYFRNIFKTIVSGQWYYAYKIPIAIFAPFINNDHHNFLIINYFYLLVALISLNYSLTLISKNLIVNFFSSIVICFFPWMWGYESIISMHQVSLDTQVYLVGLAYFSLLIKSFFTINDKKCLLYTAILAGFFTWTRGNAFAYFFSLTFPIFVIYILRYFNFNKKKKILILKKIYKPFFIFLFIFLWFIFFTFKSLFYYYSVQQNTINYDGLKTEQILNALKIIFFNYPGTFFTNSSYTSLDIINLLISIIFYVIILFSLFYFFKNKKKNLKNLVFYKFLLICFLTIVFSKLLELYNIPFYANGVSVAQTQIIILIPFSLIIVYLINIIFQIYHKKLKIFYFLYFFSIIVFSVLHGFINTNFNSPNKYSKSINENYFKRVVNPIELEKFSVEIDSYLSEPKTYILLYNFYNPVIINYYRERKNLPTLKRNWNWESDIIAPFISDPNHRGGVQKFKDSFKKILLDADYIIIPKYLENYKIMSSIIASQFYKEMFKILQDPGVPKYEVVKELNDVFDLVLIKKITNSSKKNNIYDGIKDNYENIETDINIFNSIENNFWNKMIQINSYSDLRNLDKLKNIIFNTPKNFQVINLFDKNYDTFWEKNSSKSSILIQFENSTLINSIHLFTENRKNKSKDAFHNQSIERVPSKISIKGSNNLDKWDNIVENVNINFENEISNYNFENEDKFKYYLIEFNNNEKILRLYQLKFNRNLIPNNFKEVNNG